MKRLNQYLKRRGDRWNYHRRVPLIYQSLDPRGTIRVALDTASIEIARARRDALAKADELFWRTLQSGNRPDYGDGGSLSFRRDELAKMTLNFIQPKF
jgi:hypothetical protein